MAISLQYLLRGVSRSILRNYSTVAESIRIPEESSIQTFRTNETNPLNHTADHRNRLYVIPPKIKDRLFRHGGFPSNFEDQVKTFTESAILIREPALEIISYLQMTDYSRSVNRYVLYGAFGCGKTITLSHILHYGYVSKKVLVHIPCLSGWFRNPREVAPSQTKEGFYDLPVDAAAWLVHFKHQNIELLSEIDLKLSKDYVWNTREQNVANSPLLELIDFGIVRAKYACDVVEILINELKSASTAGKCNVLVVIDGFNAFFNIESKVKGIDFKPVEPKRITITQPFIDITHYDWCNGAVVLSVEEIAGKNKNPNQSIFPRSLLGEEGFDHLDPFLPVQVPNYNDDEFEAMMEYYKERKWVRVISSQGQRELQLLSNGNPYKLMEYTAPL